MSAEFPREIITDTATKAVALTPPVEATLPGIDAAFAEVDARFLDDPEAYLNRLEDSLFRFQSSEGPDVACSLLYGPNSKLDELLVVFAPFADRDPKTSADKLHAYITADKPGGIIKKERAAPNSWNQTTKSAVIFELLDALGKGIPVLTIYSPIPNRAYNSQERTARKQGDFTPAARIAQEAIAQAQSVLHGSDSETQIDGLHLGGASLGASNAIGAASGLMDRDFGVHTVTAQELIMGPKTLRDLGKRFTISQTIGEPSDARVARDTPFIEEAALRKKIDGNGSELIGTTARTIKGMRPSYLKGLTKPEQTVQAIEKLLDNNVELLVALAENSSLTRQTASYLPSGGEHGVVRIRGEGGKDQKVGHIADEYVALSALVLALGVGQVKR